METTLDQVLDGSFLDALGLTSGSSNIPAQVTNEMAKQLEESVLFTLTASYKTVDCKSSSPPKPTSSPPQKEELGSPSTGTSGLVVLDESKCCKLLIVPGPDAPWPTSSPHLSGAQTFSLGISIDVPDIAKLTIRISISATPSFSRVSIDPKCPSSCEDDVMDVGVEVAFEVSITVKGSFHQVKSGGSLSGSLPGTINFGPKVGDQDYSGGWVRDFHVEFTVGPIKFNKNYNYLVVCDKIRRVFDDGSTFAGDPSASGASASPPLPPTLKPGGSMAAPAGQCPNPKPPNEVQVDRVPPARKHYPCPGDHWHCLEYHQVPFPDCRIFKKRTFGGCLPQGAPGPASC